MMGLRYEKEAHQIREMLTQLVLFGPAVGIKGSPELAATFSQRPQLAAQLAGNIIGVGIGSSESEVHVELRTVEESPIEQQDFLCKQFPQVPAKLLRFKKVGKIVAQQAPQPENKIRPAPGGVSISHGKVIGFGTLGCWVTDASGKQYVLSNNHVLTNPVNRASPKDEILQPGLGDRPKGKLPGDEIARFTRCVPIQFYDNKVDAAIAEVQDNSHVDPRIMDIGRIQGIRGKSYDLLGLTVQKFGRRTKRTTGTITAMDLTIKVDLDGFAAIFIDQIEIFGSEARFSNSGDSGSLILDKDKKAVGLLFAGSIFGATYANTIDNVLNELSVSLVM